MTRIVRWLNNSLVIFCLLVAGTLTDLVLLGLANDLSKSDWSSWVQAVGSIVAILVAVWIMHAQNRQAALRDVESERATLRNVLRALRAEIDLHLPTITELRDMPASAIMGNIDITFPIYHACAGSLGSIDDNSLRDDIVNIYAAIQQTYSISRDRSAAIRRLIAEGESPSHNSIDEAREASKALLKICYTTAVNLPLISTKLESAAALLDTSVRHR